MSNEKCNGRCSTGKLQATYYICDHNNLKALFPELCEEWDYTKNDKNPEQYLPGSNAKTWWICPIGKCECHNYQAKITDRKKGFGCPACRKFSRVVCPHNGYTLLEKYPEVAKEWSSKNIKTAADYLPYSRFKAWWTCNKCPGGKLDCHTWQTEIYHRTNGNAGCPYCNNRKICEHNMREDGTVINRYKIGSRPLSEAYKEQKEKNENKIHDENNNLLSKFPEICKEWHPDNKKGPEEYTPCSSARVKWLCRKCPQDEMCHSWIASIVSRTTKKSKCPFCTIRSVCIHNGLQAFFPEMIANEWDYEKNILDPRLVARSSDKKAHWLCPYNPNHKYIYNI